MSHYDFTQLSPHDFEQLARDLLQARDGIVLESFTTGRDGGIDFRYARGQDAIIVQCKHYAGTGAAGLLRDLQKEADKVAQLQPSRYILVTSVGLTPHNKAQAAAPFSGRLAGADILGRDDLNNLLGLHPGVEQRHYKLWLASKAVLDRVIHNASITQSEFDVQRIYKNIQRYVRSAAYPRAGAMLDTEHVAIISGPPGVGKTSLAELLLYTHLCDGYELVSILTDWNSARARFQPGQRQIFYFDDFLGATFLGERTSTLARNEDRALLDFIALVRATPTARLVMTTREHILGQALAASERLRHASIVDSRCIIELRDYSYAQRAEILYNHIYFSDLPRRYRAVLLADRFYQTIVAHHKFSPRIIDWLSNFRRVHSVPPADYARFVAQLLADPGEVWRHAYEQEISPAAQSVLLALYSLDGECAPLLLEAAFHALHAIRAQRYRFATAPSDWRRALAELHGAFILPGRQVRFINPSVIDMLNAAIREDAHNALDLIEGALQFRQARRTWNFTRSQAPAVHAFLCAKSAELPAAFERLLQAPGGYALGDEVMPDDSAAVRIETTLQICASIHAPRLRDAALNMLDSLLENWQTAPFNVGAGLPLLLQIDAMALPEPAKEALRRRMITTLCHLAPTTSQAATLAELIGILEPGDLDQQKLDLLRSAAETYRDEHFHVELEACVESDYVFLEDYVRLIAEETGVDFTDALNNLRHEADEYWDYRTGAEWQAEQARAHHVDRFDHPERGLDDLFDSLRDDQD